MTDQTKAVAALAEATDRLVDLIGGGAPDPQDRYYCKAILRELIANPDILREYGIGRLPTRKDLDNLPYKERGTSVTLGEFNIALMIEAGWCLPDPQPPEPTLREQVARMLYSAENPTFKWDSVPSQWHHRRMFDMADTIIGNFDITLKAPRP